MTEKFTEAHCLAEAREYYAFAYKSGKDNFTVALNRGRDRVVFENSFLEKVAFGSDDGDLKDSWSKAGWVNVGPRVISKLEPDAIRFRLLNGLQYWLAHDDLRHWYKTGEFPAMRDTPPCDGTGTVSLVWQDSQNIIHHGVDTVAFNDSDE